jgi:hypothetical protein
MAAPRFRSGYAYVTPAGDQSWRHIPNDVWGNQVVGSQGEYPRSMFMGARYIDDSWVYVWRVGDEYFAQLAYEAYTVAENPLSRRTLWIAGLGAASIAGISLMLLARPAAAATSPTVAPAAPQDPQVLSTLQALMALDPTALCQGANAQVVAFQNAWNNAVNAMGAAASGQYGSVPATGQYDQATASVAYQVNTSAPSPCAQFAAGT